MGMCVCISRSVRHGGSCFGGWAFAGPDDASPAVLSTPWPDDVKEALRQFKLPQAQRTPGAPLLSMPAAELFTILAVAAAAPVWTHCPGVDVLEKGSPAAPWPSISPVWTPGCAFLGPFPDHAPAVLDC